MGVGVWVGVGVNVGVLVGVGALRGQTVEAVAVPAVPPPDAESSKVPIIPLVLTLVDCPEVS